MILLLGATGYIGQAFAIEMHKRGLAFVPLTRSTIDYTRFDALFHYVRTTRPEFVVNAAGFTGKPDLETCEIYRAETVQANTLLPQTVARVCYLTKTPWGHVSSGSIYSGAKVRQNGGVQVVRDLNQPEIRRHFDTAPEHFTGFAESDEPNFSFRSPPCSFYSGTKALAEEALRWYGESYVWRPGMVFGESDHPRNFLSTVQRTARIPDGANSFSHQGEFVRACLDLWQGHAPFGTYHIANAGVMTGREVAETVQRILKVEQPSDSDRDRPETSPSDIQTPQANYILDTAKLVAAGVKMRPIQEAIRESLEKWDSSARTRAWLQGTPSAPSPLNTPGT
jgi:UDP-glucose 4,6-dehydratase